MHYRDLGDGRLLRSPVLGEGELRLTGGDLASQFDVRQRYVTGDLGELRGRGSIARSVLDRVVVRHSQFSPLILMDVVVTGADLSDSVWDHVTFRRVELRACLTAGWRAGLEMADDVAFVNCRLDSCQIAVNRTRGHVLFENCVFNDTVLAGNLDNFVFHGCDLSGVEFEASSATGADLRTSRITGARGLFSLRGAKLSIDQLVAAADSLAHEAGLEIVA